MKSQSAIEFMSIVALGLVLIGIASFFGVDYITSYFSDINVVNAQQVVEGLISSINLVYAQGVGATTKVYVTIPSNLDRSGTYIYGDEVTLRFRDGSVHDVYKTTKVNVYGSIPLNPGRVTLTVKMTEYGAIVFVNDHTISSIVVEVYNDSSYQNQDNTFSPGETVYYSFYLANESYDFSASSDVNLTIYYPNGTIATTSVVSVTNAYSGSYVVGNALGRWVISAMIPDSKVIGAAVFKVT
ncbi:MAG: hypothetical protein J7K73_02210 [Nanoarchaeota archaeon]|nr:hypothetical protein [Nanoarchaeota archaeon]